MIDTDTKYERPPIIQAVVELAFENEMPEKKVRQAGKKLLKNYSGSEDEYRVTIEKKVLHPEYAKEDVEFIGNKLTSKDKDQLCLVRKNSLNTIQLAPYCGWDEFSSRARRDWSIWKNTVGHQKVWRIGVRFVNRIDIPLAQASAHDPSDFLTAYPKLPFTDRLTGHYVMHVDQQLEDSNFCCKITTGTVDSPVPENRSLVLDIDIYSTSDIPLKDSDLWERIKSFQVEKNHIFESCITDRTRELFRAS